MSALSGLILKENNKRKSANVHEGHFDIQQSLYV